MRVLILWADDASPNLGVRALGRGTAALVRQRWPHAEVVFQNYGTRAAELPFGRLRDLGRERLTARLGMMRWLAGFDLAIDTRSGDSFADIYGLHRLAVMSTVSRLVRQAGVPLVLGPQTIGPFTSARGRMLARASLRDAALVMARDSVSAVQADRLGRPVDVLTSDVVFALPVPDVAKSREIVVNVSGLLWEPNRHLDHLRYRDTVRRLLSALRAEGRQVSLLAHVLDSPNADNDVRAIGAITREEHTVSEVVIPEGLDEVREVVASAGLVIGSRMHACLNALSVGTPAIPLAYSRKFEPLLADLGWGHTVDLRGRNDVVERVQSELAAPGLPAEAASVAARARHLLSAAAAQLGRVEKRGEPAGVPE